jgi:hypothetical protein
MFSEMTIPWSIFRVRTSICYSLRFEAPPQRG